MKHTTTNQKRIILILMLAMFMSAWTLESQAQFTSGNIVALQVGDGTAALGSTGTAIFLKEFTTAGAPGFSVTIPTTGGTRTVESGSATSDGYFTRTPDGSNLIMGGYDAALATVGIASSASATVPRVINTINNAGTVTRVASSNTFFNTNNFRGVTSDNTNYWGTGGNDGVDYFGPGAPATIENGKVNLRCAAIFNNQLYVSSGSAAGTPNTTGIFSVNGGLPTSGTNALTTLINTTVGTSPSPYAFSINSSTTLVYVADDRTIANGGGIQRWSFNGSTWSRDYTLSTGSTVGARGLLVDFSGANPVIYATTVEASSQNKIIKITDTGAASAATTIVTSATNTAFRGLAFAPVSSCTAPTISAVTSNSPICSASSLTLGVTLSAGSTPLTYAWSGTGTFSSTTDASPTVTGAASGNYTVTVSNSCGSATGTVTVVVNPSPNVTTGSYGPVCGSSSLIALAGNPAGGTWTGTGVSGSVNNYTFNPAAGSQTLTYNYTDVNGCSGSASTLISVFSGSTAASGILASATEFCLNNCGAPTPPIVLTVQGGSLGSGASWVWYSGSCGGTPAGSGASLNVSPSSATTYFVRAENGTCFTSCISIPITIK